MKTSAGLLIAAIALGGCGHVPVIEDGLDLPARRDRLEAISAWTMRGRLAVNTGERAFQGRFEWRQDVDDLMLLVRGPFGASVFEISGSPEFLTLRARGESWQLNDPEVELSQLIGWWLPVTSLNTWLIGLPDKLFESDSAIERDGVLVSLEQRLWQLQYRRYQLAEGLLLPRRIDMSHESLQLRLTVDTWNSLPEASSSLN